MQPTYYNRFKLRGGNYESITCYGANIMLGSVRTDDLRLRGDLYGDYALRVGNLHATGSLRVPQMRCNTAFWYGNSSARCEMQITKQISLNGRFIGEGTIVSPVVRMNGTITYNGHITAGEIIAQGELALGTLDANDVRIEFAERSRITSIRGLRVVISRRPLNAVARLLLPGSLSRNSFCSVSGSINGDVVNIENVIAEKVTGNDIIIGPGCQIDKVYYRDHIYIDENAWVGWYEPTPDGAATSDAPEGPSPS